MDPLQVVVTAVVSGLIGGGLISKVLFRSLRDQLRETFVSHDDLNGIGARVNGLESVTIGARERADAAHAATDQLRIMLHSHVESMTQHVVKPLEKISDRMDHMAVSQAAQAATLKALADQVNARSIADSKAPRNRRSSP